MSSLNDIYSDMVVDAVVLGGGIAGLIAARDLLEKGRKSFPRVDNVIILEARNRIGGRVSTKLICSGANMINSSQVNYTYDLGAEWFDTESHNAVIDEAKRYRAEFVHSEYRSMFKFNGRKSVTFNASSPVPEAEASEFRRVMLEINRDVGNIKLASATTVKSQMAFDGFDRPYIDYVENSLKATGAVRGFLLSQGFAHAGADSQVHFVYDFTFL
jgi:monoamine oxidase